MKHCSRTLLCTFCTICVFSIVKPEVSDVMVDNDRMHLAVRSMLGFAGEPRGPRPALSADNAPKYMLDLYNMISEGRMSTEQLQGNTVRSIQSSIETVNGQPMFVFNLTSLSSAEKQNVSAEIHFYKRRKSRYNKKAHLTMSLHEIATGHTKDSGAMSVSLESYGWQRVDVSDIVQSCVSENTLHPQSLGLNFKMSKPHHNSNLLQLKRFMHKHSVPYLVVYSNDSKTIDEDELEDLSEKQKGIDHLHEAYLKTESLLPPRTRRSKRSLLDNNADYPIYQSRARSLSILTNEIPEDPEDYNKPYPIHAKTLQTHPGMLQTRKESRHKISDPRLIPLPGEYASKKKRRRDRKRNKRKKGQKDRMSNRLELPKEWDDLRELAEDEKKDGSCGRKKLVVDFSDIGWGEWIISPKSFKAHYCAGSCTFPLTKKMRPSNHATIQSLVNAVGIDPDVPAPCCVPDKLSSITLLYFDENGNVVLKNYPNMTVQKCACR
ncbi:bone morphogenetic protein 3-like [Mya arenaria]|uniref:bone morphogenetic protein 3-like n=1 Tax=Mya arenaria TaxID=6604 RepID=UPI0022DECA11|nr:bone morphogenetic protein 3-like [Mya arenaria]